MAKNTAPEENGEQKVMTKYDRKMEERRKQKEKDKKQEKMTKTIAIVVGIVLVAAIAFSIIRPIAVRQTALKGTYIQIGEHNISRLEYDYYYNRILSNYAAYGVDTSSDLSTQMVSENLSFKDMIDQSTAEQIRQIKVVADDGRKNGFSCDTDANYETFVSEVKVVAKEQGVNVNEYYKEAFGTFATESNLAPIVKEESYAEAYYQELLEKNAPSDEEVKAYYEENKADYDKVDYRSFILTADVDADASEEAAAEAMKKSKADAEEMAKSRREGTDFNELCLTYAPEESKENYEDPETDYSLAEGRYRYSLTTVMADWLYDDTRAEGDIEVLEDTDNNRYYVVEFIKRYYDEADNDRISSTISSEEVSNYLDGLKTGDAYQIVDPKGNLKYLTVAEEEGSQEIEEE